MYLSASYRPECSSMYLSPSFRPLSHFQARVFISQQERAHEETNCGSQLYRVQPLTQVINIKNLIQYINLRYRVFFLTGAP